MAGIDERILNELEKNNELFYKFLEQQNNNSNRNSGNSNLFDLDNFRTKDADINAILNSSSSWKEKNKELKDLRDNILDILDEKTRELETASDKYKILKNAYEENSSEEILEELNKARAESSKLESEVSNLKSKVEDCGKAISKNFDSSKFGKVLGKVQSINEGVKNISTSLKGMWQTASDLAQPWAKADNAASKYAKTLALTKAGMDSLRSTTIDNVVHSRIGINYNMSTEELIQAQQSYLQGIGRILRIDNVGQENLAAMHAVMGSRSNDLAVAFENFGVSLERTGEHAGKMFDEAAKKGISFEKYSDNVAKNIKIAQNYTFKNGLKGLESMAQKAVALRMDMGQIASLADKISTVEGSIDVASKLQVLGGPFASMADPMGMMSEGLMDMEGLMDRITNMIGGLGNFDKATGEVRVSAFNKQRIRAMAQATGMDYSQLMESVNVQAKRKEIEAQINSSANARGLSSDMQELIKNSAIFNKEGEAGVSINGEFKTLEQLQEKDYQTLIKETQNESADIKDIARTLRGWDDVMQGFTKQKEAVQAQLTGWLGHSMKGLAKVVGRTNWLLGIIVGGKIFGGLTNIVAHGFNAIKSGTGLWTTIKNIFSSGGRVKSAGNRITGLFTRGGTTNATRQSGRRLLTRFGESALGGQAGRFGVSSITSVDKLGTNLSNKGFTKLGNYVSRHAATQAEKYGLKGVAKQGGKRIAAKTASKIGTKMAAGVAKGGVLGIVGAAGNIATDMMVEKGKIEKGGTAHAAMKIGSTALEGAALGATIGSVIPGIGTAIGTAIGAIGGAVVGAVKMAKVRAEQRVDNKLGRLGLERKGKYGAAALGEINRALDNGKLSNRVRRKLERQGDLDILAEIDKVKQKKEEEAEAKKDRKAERWSKLLHGSSGNIAKNIARANISVDNAFFSGKAFGTTPIEIGDISKKKDTIKNLFKILNPLYQTRFLGKVLTGEKIGLIKTNLETGFSKETETLKRNVESQKYENQREEYLKSQNENAKIQEKQEPITGKIDLNISGTIKLVGANGQSIEITKELENSSQFRDKLTEIISKELLKQKFGGNVQVRTAL